MENNTNQTCKNIFKIQPYRGLTIFDVWKYGVPTKDIFCGEKFIYIEETIGSGMFPVKKETLSPALFAADKNKNQIYGGDIVRITTLEGVYENGVVFYARYNCAWAVKFGDKAVLFSDLYSKKDDDSVIFFPNVEITGNIHTGAAEGEKDE